jgi:iron complex outermembrane receptor protein
MINKKLFQSLFILINISVFSLNAQDLSNESFDEIEEVVTTARRREESVTDVPIAISAFSGSDLEASGIDNMEYLNEIVPNMLMVKANVAQNGVAVGLRGLGSSRSSAQWDQKIAIYIDDAYQLRPQGALFDLFDISNVQVLKGPQGTLFGKNTTSGAILVNNNTPVMDVLESTVRLTMGQRNLNDLAVMLNIPISSNAAMRIVGMQKKQDGYINNLDSNGKDGGIVDNLSGRVMLSVDLSEDINILLTNSIFQTSGTPVYPNCNVYTNGATLGGNTLLSGFTPGQKQRAFDACSLTGHYDSYHDNSFKDSYLDVEKSSFKMTYDLGESMLTFIHSTAKTDDLEQPWAMGFLRSGFDDIAIAGPRETSTDGSTTEIRLSGAVMNDRLRYTFGYFESELDGTGFFPTIYGGGFKPSSQTIPLGIGLDSLAGLPVNLTDVATMAVTQLSNANEYLTTSAVSEAIYGEIIFAATDKLNLTLGLRSSEDTKGQTNSAKYPAGGMNLNPTYLTIGLTGLSPYLLPLAQAIAPFQVAGADAWEIDLFTGAARYQASKCDSVYGSFSNPLLGGTGLCTLERTYNNDSMRFIVDYTMDSGNMFYASYSEGYMPGNANDSILGAGVSAQEAETTEVMEIGTKSSFMNGKLSLSAAYFDQDFLNKSITVGGTTAAGAPTVNTVIQPVVEMSGYELDLSYKLTDAFTLRFALGHVEGDEGGDLEYNVAGAEDTYSISLTHSGMIGKIPTTTVLRSYTASDDIMTSYKDMPGMDCSAVPTYNGCSSNGGNGHLSIPEYTLMNLNVSLMISDKATVNFFVENLGDEEYSFAGFDLAAIGMHSFYSGPPRTTGISFTIDY